MSKNLNSNHNSFNFKKVVYLVQTWDELIKTSVDFKPVGSYRIGLGINIEETIVERETLWWIDKGSGVSGLKKYTVSLEKNLNYNRI